jgi:hypothetical protein
VSPGPEPPAPDPGAGVVHAATARVNGVDGGALSLTLARERP